MSASLEDKSDALLSLRRVMDETAAVPVKLYFATAVFWLLAGTFFGLATSLKFDLPDWLGSTAALTFGRLRPAHLNAVTYGWASLAGSCFMQDSRPSAVQAPPRAAALHDWE